VHAIPVLLISVPGLLALLNGARGPAVAARRGWWFGLGLHVIGLYWITEAILFEADRSGGLYPLPFPLLPRGWRCSLQLPARSHAWRVLAGPV